MAITDPGDVLAARPIAQLPAWHPPWAHQLAEAYFSGTTSLFILHGNVHDLVYNEDEAGGYSTLIDFLVSQVFGRWDLVVGYDVARGLRALAGANVERLRGMMQHLAARWGDPVAWPREADRVLPVLDSLLDRNLLEEPPRRKSIALVFEYAQYLAPAGDIEAVSRGQAPRLVRFLAWAQNPLLKRVNVAVCLVADRLSELNDRLTQTAHAAAIEVPLPDRNERRRFCQRAWEEEKLSGRTSFNADQLAEMSNGLTLVDLNVLLSQGGREAEPIDAARFGQLKKTMIERQCRGLVEFVEPSHTLDMVVGFEEAKKRLREDAQQLTLGHLDAAPMGYLICGPVGTGKTFLAECYAGSIGIPCLSLKNFRSKYVGETEGNLEQVLAVLRWLGPVVVIVDEADAALGNRQADGDSGTSARVFSMIASQMGNTRYRGKIIWMLLTSRPDLLPIDLKRQGRAEVHIPLFYPREEAEIRAMFEVLAKKNRVEFEPDALPSVSPERRLTGADIESIVLAARRESRAAGRTSVSRAEMERALAEFIPSAQGLEKELQELAAVLECTQVSFLPPHWRAKLQEADGRSRLQERMVAIRQLIEQ